MTNVSVINEKYSKLVRMLKQFSKIFLFQGETFQNISFVTTYSCYFWILYQPLSQLLLKLKKFNKRILH